MSEEKADLLQLPLLFGSDATLPSAYATNMVVQRTEHEYILRFYEAEPPFILDATPEERMAKLRELGGVSARCVARVVIAEARLPKFVQVLQQHLARTTEAKAAAEAKAADAEVTAGEDK